MRRLTAALTLTLTLGLFLTGCDRSPTATDAQPDPTDPTAKTAQQGAAAHAPRAKPVDPATPMLALEPENPEKFVSIVQEAQKVEEGEEQENASQDEWEELWGQLRFQGAEELSGTGTEVAIWGVLVVDGERKKSFLTDPREVSGEGPADLFEVPEENLYPEPDEWTPGDEYIRGSEFKDSGGNLLPPVARYFRGNAWYPQPDSWTPGSGSNVNAAPANWRVNGVVDGIFSPAGGIGGMTDQTKAQLLLMPVAQPPDLDASATKGPPSTGGILIRYIPVDPQK